MGKNNGVIGHRHIIMAATIKAITGGSDTSKSIIQYRILKTMYIILGLFFVNFEQNTMIKKEVYKLPKKEKRDKKRYDCSLDMTRRLLIEALSNGRNPDYPL